MTRPPQIQRDTIDNGLANLERTNILLVGGSTYEYLDDLNGPSIDLEMMNSIFVDDHDISLFDVSQVTQLSNPTSHDFRKAITEYAHAREPRGDILILYFSGHGCSLPGSIFGFCFKDTKLNYQRSGILPLSAVSIGSVIQTLSAVDVYPVFILDACFSGVTAPNGEMGATISLDSLLRSSHADSYALIASSNSQAFSMDSPSGGPFTQALFTIALEGLSGKTGKRYPFISLGQLASPLQVELEKLGAPLSRCHVGQTLPFLPFAKNIRFEPQTESFSGYMKRIVELLWNNGSPIENPVAEFSRKIGQGAYANHSKLSLPPWDLLEDAGSNRIRKLTRKGIQFAEGKKKIPRRIVKDYISGDWVADKGTERITIHDIG